MPNIFFEPRNGRMANVIAASDVGQGFPGFPSRKCFEDLVAGEFELAAKPDAPGLGPLPAFGGPGLDQLPVQTPQGIQGP
jgi:hypothetical protein